jgi:transmembrane sensor
MSGDTVPAHQARMRAAEWLERRVAEDWCAEEQAALDAWLGEAPANRIAWLRVSSAWDKADRIAALQAPPPAQTASVRVFPIFLRLAAAFAVLAVIGIAGSDYISRPEIQTFATGVGGHKIIRLGDGSSIELNTGTLVTTNMGVDHRTVTIARGEAYFQVHHDSARPFIVLAAGHRLIDLGTKFLVRTQASHLEVALVSGRARLETAAPDVQEHSAVLKPGDVAMASADSMSVAREPLGRIVDALAWRRGMLVFRHVTLAKAAAEFNRYNERKLVVGKDAERLKINGTFAKNSIEAFARTAQYALALNVTYGPGSIVLSR